MLYRNNHYGPIDKFCSRHPRFGIPNLAMYIAIAQVAVRPMVLTVLQTAVFFLVLFLAGIVVRVVVRMGQGVNRIPLVGGLNRMAGLLLLAGLGGNRWEWLNSGILQDTILIRRFLSLRELLP